MKRESRITIDIPTSIHKQFKSYAAKKGKSMREMVVDLINLQLLLPIEHDDTQECRYSHTPNAQTIEALENIKKGKNLVRAKNAKDLFKKLGL